MSTEKQEEKISLVNKQSTNPKTQGTVEDVGTDKKEEKKSKSKVLPIVKTTKKAQDGGRQHDDKRYARTLVSVWSLYVVDAPPVTKEDVESAFGIKLD